MMRMTRMSEGNVEVKLEHDAQKDGGEKNTKHARIRAALELQLVSGFVSESRVRNSFRFVYGISTSLSSCSILASYIVK